MKKIILIVLAVNIIFPLIGKAQQIDPTLTGAVILQTEELKAAYKKRNETQNKLIAAQTAVAAAMDQIHRVENKVLEYMSNASSAMDNIYQLKKAAELVSVNIPSQMKKMVDAVPTSFQGTSVTMLTSKTCQDLITEMTTLYSFMSQLVVSSSYSFGEKDSSDSKKKNINLLSAAERYYIANEVVYRLQKIYRKLWIITWEIQNLGWEDAWRNLDGRSWVQYKHGKSISNQLIKQWQRATTFK